LTEVDPVLKPCITCGVPTTATRCEAHTLPKYDAPGRASRQSRGYDAAWQRLSSKIRAARPWCELCGTSQARLTVDHIIPMSLGGDNSAGNLRVLCLDCHNRYGATKRRPRILG
jgi:5-methylcytosine-specific restriction protein A